MIPKIFEDDFETVLIFHEDLLFMLPVYFSRHILFWLFLNRGARPPTLLICCLVLPYTHNGDNDRSGSKMHFTLFYKVGIFCQGWPQALVVLPPCGQLLCLNYKCMLCSKILSIVYEVKKIPLDTSVAHQGWRQQENKNLKRSNRLIFSSAL